jgi:hypothetical protein
MKLIKIYISIFLAMYFKPLHKILDFFSLKIDIELILAIYSQPKKREKKGG